ARPRTRGRSQCRAETGPIAGFITRGKRMDAQLAYHLRRLALLALFIVSLVFVAILAFAWVRSYSPADPVARHALTFREGRIYFTDANTDLEALEHDREWRESTVLGFNSRPNVQMCPVW